MLTSSVFSATHVGPRGFHALLRGGVGYTVTAGPQGWGYVDTVYAVYERDGTCSPVSRSIHRTRSAALAALRDRPEDNASAREVAAQLSRPL